MMCHATEKPNAQAAQEGLLTGRRILFVGVGYFTYDALITDGLRAMGAEVEAIAERPPLLLQSHPLSSLANMLPWLRRSVQRRHEEKLKAQLADCNFDTVLVVKGDSLDVGFFDHLRHAHPNATFILYQWDSINLVRNFAELRTRFDRCLTFDRLDASADKTLIFRPLFFSRSVETPSKARRGLIFVGSLHSRRLKVARQIKAHAKAKGIPVRIYIRVGLFNYIRLLITADLRDIHFRPLPYETYVAWTEDSEAVLDFPHPLQTGLTMRTVEAIGLGKKIITSNKDIVNYPFYDPKFICVVDDEDAVIPEGFLNNSPLSYDAETLAHFSLRQWLLDVLNFGSISDCRNDKAK